MTHLVILFSDIIPPGIRGGPGNIKTKNKRIKKFGKIPDDNFILYLRETEFRYNISSLSNPDKEKKLYLYLNIYIILLIMIYMI